MAEEYRGPRNPGTQPKQLKSGVGYNDDSQALETQSDRQMDPEVQARRLLDNVLIDYSKDPSEYNRGRWHQAESTWNYHNSLKKEQADKAMKPKPKDMFDKGTK